jgi:response regulator RpfG family c-di-GMP phosphodiesterase
MSRILIADTPQSSISLKAILDGYDLIVASTMVDALANLKEEKFDLVVVGIHFDDSQMFELIRYVQSSANNAERPVISYCARDTAMARVIHESIEMASKAAGAWMYLDAHSYNVFKEPEQELRRVFQRCLIDESRKEIHLKRLKIQSQRAELHRMRTLLKAQEWSPELEEQLTVLKSDLEVLLQEVAKLQAAADNHRADVAASRQLKDRVSAEVFRKENGLERTERIQQIDETRQTLQEEVIIHEEQERKRKRQAKLQGS